MLGTLLLWRSTVALFTSGGLGLGLVSSGLGLGLVMPRPRGIKR